MLSAKCSHATALHVELQRMGVRSLTVTSELSEIGRRQCGTRHERDAAARHERGRGYSYSAIYDK